MNERIQKLMTQAMESTGVEGLGGEYRELNPEKFAKLIIQECIDRINRVGILEDVEFQSGMIAQNVREHFGVEE